MAKTEQLQIQKKKVNFWKRCENKWEEGKNWYLGKKKYEALGCV